MSEQSTRIPEKKVEAISFYQLVSVKFRRINGKTDYNDVMLLETNKYIVVIDKPESFVRLLSGESEMLHAYIENRQIKQAIEWIEGIIIAYMQNPQKFEYRRTKDFLRHKARKLPADAQYTAYNTGRLEALRQTKWIWFQKALLQVAVVSFGALK